MADRENGLDSDGLLPQCARGIQGTSYLVSFRDSMEIDLRKGACYVISRGIFELRFYCISIKIRLYFLSIHHWTWQREDTDAPNDGESPPDTVVSNRGSSSSLK